MHHMNTPANPTNVRLTITVSPEVHETFSRMAKAGGMSISRCMGEWLGDTLDAATFTAQKMEEARAAPRLVVREMHSYALGLMDETKELMDKIGKGERTRPGQARPGLDASGLASPPSCNTGGKVPSKRKGKGGQS